MKVFTSVMLDMRGEVKNIFWGSGSACCVCLHENLSLRKYMLQNSNEQRFFSPHINLKSKFKHAPALMKISCLKKVITRYTIEARDFIDFCMVVVIKNPPANARDIKRSGFDHWVRRIPWRRQPSPIIPVWRILMDRGAWWAAAHSVTVSHNWVTWHTHNLNTHHSDKTGERHLTEFMANVFATPWTVVCRVSLSMRFSRQE